MKASDEFQDYITTSGYDINTLHQLWLKTKLLRHCIEIAENAVPEEKFVVLYNELKVDKNSLRIKVI